MFFSQQIKNKAVAYYRHSAEDKQENSIAIQREHIYKFAWENQIEIIHEEADEGKSGLSANRPGFDQLFRDWILNPSAPAFDYVLVYDVSRWGRFQDLDEAAHLEVRCRHQGRQVVYVSHGFPQEGQQLTTHLQTSIERYMAAEYSRQLSDKVFYGSVKVSEQGFSAGGRAPYGMTRILLDETKKPVAILKKGEHKVIANQRVTFAPTYDQTTETVKTIFSLFVEQQFTPQRIASYLNAQKLPSPNGGIWNSGKIIRLLTNETYTGARIYNKTWSRLKQKQRVNPRSAWIMCPNAFEAIVCLELFKRAQERLYWSSPSRLNRSIYFTSKVKKELQKDLEKFLKVKFGIDDDKLWQILREFPLIFSLPFYNKDSVPHWCFIIKEEIKRYRYVIAVAIGSLRQNSIIKFFLIPTKNFGLGGFFILDEKNPQYRSYLIEEKSLEENILAVYRELAILE